MRLIFLFIYFINIVAFSLPFLKEQNQVVLHLEKFNEKFNLLHVGISFNNNRDIIRFDFRPHNYGKTYLTTEKDRMNFDFIFPDANGEDKYINLFEDYRNTLIFDTENIYKKNVFWGITNKSQNEILEFERDVLINRRYKLGLYDCRHFVNEFTIWCLDKPTPIWKLKNLWNDIN
tara:strand:+ start:1272 stop:1796 length:525 start_codon:yes stop_codon:yes gene_type:complete